MQQKINFDTWWRPFSFRPLKWRHQVAKFNFCFIEASPHVLFYHMKKNLPEIYFLGSVDYVSNIRWNQFYQIVQIRERIYICESSCCRPVRSNQCGGSRTPLLLFWRRFLERAKLLYKIWPPKWFFQKTSFISF